MNSPEMVRCKTLEESLQECQGSAQVPEVVIDRAAIELSPVN
jgi:hypothetical protein